jgi:hypothetical protein
MYLKNIYTVYKKNFTSHAKESFVANILVIVFQFYQRFLIWSKKVNSPASFLDNKYTGQNAVLIKAIENNTGSSNSGRQISKKIHFCNWFLCALHGSFFDPNLIFFTDEARLLLSGCVNT